jgi:hypothetical protein
MSSWGVPRSLEKGLHRDARQYGEGELSDITDLNAKVIPIELAEGRYLGGAVVSHLAEPVYIVAFNYSKKVNGYIVPIKISNEVVTMQFLASGFKSGPDTPRTEQIEEAFGDVHDLIVCRQLYEDEIKACGKLALKPHNGIYAAPLTRGSAVYMRMTKNEDIA